MKRLTIWMALLAAVTIAAVPAAVAKQGKQHATVNVQLLAINDLHGNLEPPTGSSGLVNTTTAGGAEYLATHLKQDVAQNPNSLVIAAGDLIGASPLLSALFHDEPTIESLNLMNLTVSSVGNHEFERARRSSCACRRAAATRRTAARTATRSAARSSTTSPRTS